MTTIANSVAAKFAVATVAIAMMFSVVAPAQAQTAEELQAQIDALMATINELQAELGVSGGDDMMSSSSVCPYTWTRSLNMGDTGSDVMMLQKFLNADAATQVAVSGAGSAGNETEYYGPATGAAVAKFQEMYRAEILSPLGLVNSTTFFGNSTRAQANTLCVAAPADDSSDDAADDSSDDSTDDSSDDSTATLGNDEGDITNVASTAADESNIEEGQTEGIFAFDFEVEGDVEVNRVDFFIELTDSTSASDNADDYFEGASLWLDGDKIADMDVSDFDDDDYTGNVTDGATTDTEYRLRFSGLDLVFADGDEPEFQLAFETMSSLDSADLAGDWDVVLDSIRFVDGQGFTDSVDGIAITDDFGFDAEEVAELSITEASDSPDDDTVEVDDNDQTDDVEMFIFEIEEENGVDVTIEDLRVTITSTGTTDESAVVADASLWNGSTELDSSSVPAGGVVDFENMGIELGADDTVELTVKLTLEDTNSQVAYQDGDTVTVAFTSVRDAEDANGNDEGDMTISGTPAGSVFTLREAGMSVELVSEDTSETENDDTTNADDEGVFEIVFDVTAFGDDLYLPFGSSRTATATDGVTWEILDDNGSVVSTGTTTPSLDVDDSNTEETNSYLVQDGDTERFTLEVTFDPAASGSFKLRVNSINFAASDSATSATAQDVSDLDIDTSKLTIQS